MTPYRPTPPNSQTVPTITPADIQAGIARAHRERARFIRALATAARAKVAGLFTHDAGCTHAA